MRPLRYRKTEKRESEHPSNDSWEGGGLLDFNAPDANIPIKAEDGVLLCTYAVGELDRRAIRQSYLELCRGEFNEHLDGRMHARDGEKKEKICRQRCYKLNFYSIL